MDSHQDQETYYYFYMKAGFANCFLPHAEVLGGLWVGYAGLSIPELSSDGLCSSESKEKADLKYLTVASSKKWRKKIRVVTFGKDALLVWEITDDLKTLDRAAGEIDWGNKALYRSFDKGWQQEVRTKMNGIGSKEFYGYHFGKTGWKLLPARILEVISRERLIAPVDSLSVWQSFSRNTFQPMFSLEGNTTLRSLSWLNKTMELPPLPVTEKYAIKENLFGRFIRTYLDQKIDPEKPSPLKTLSPHERRQTVLSILNPAQVETAAMLLCQDLGLTVDVGLGKGLDVADVKATVRHLSNERKEKITSALSTLEKVGVQFSDKLRDSIKTSATIRLQCKAASGIESLGTVLTVEPNTDQSMKQKQDRLSLEQLVQSNVELPRVREWISLLEYDLTAK